MTLFQWIALPILGLMFVWDFSKWVRTHFHWNLRLFRCLFWLAAAIAIADPFLVQTVASFLGIQTGANLVLYLFVLIFVATSFAFYGRYLRLQRQMNHIVRYLAMQEAKRGGEPKKQ